MSNIKKSYNAAYKQKVAIAAIKQELSQSQISTQYEVHTTQINKWKKEALESIAEGFKNKREKQAKEDKQIIEELYKQVGKLNMELAWLKKKSGFED